MVFGMVADSFDWFAVLVVKIKVSLKYNKGNEKKKKKSFAIK